MQSLLQNANTFSFPEKFDAAICMWTTLGEEPLQYWKVIKNIYMSLKKRGIFVLDNTSWEHIPQTKEKFIEKTTTTDKGVSIKTNIHDRFTKNFRIRDIVYEIDGKEYKDLCITHILKEKDWVRELEKAGFNDFEVYRDYKLVSIEKPYYIDIIAVK